MSLFGLLVVLILVGVALYLIPMDAKIKQVITVLVVVFVVLIVLGLLLGSNFGNLGNIRIGR